MEGRHSHSHRHFHQRFHAHPRRATAPRNGLDDAQPVADATIPERAAPVVEPRAAKSSCVTTEQSDTCQLPTDGGANNLAIILGVIIPVVMCILVCIYLHRRFLARQRREDNAEAHKSLDFGTEFARKNRKPGGKPIPEMTVTNFEKSIRRGKGMSMDLDMNSPYILPAALKGSRESLHSLSRSMKDDYDPYRPVTMASEQARYPRVRGDNGSIMTGMTGSSHGTYATDAPSAGLLKNATGMSQSRPTRGDSMSTRNETMSPSLSRATTLNGNNSALANEVLPPPPPPPPKSPQPHQVPQQEKAVPTLALPEIDSDSDSYFEKNAHDYMDNSTFAPPPRTTSNRQPQSPPDNGHASHANNAAPPQIAVQEYEDYDDSYINDLAFDEHRRSIHEAHAQAQQEQHSYNLGVDQPDYSQNRLSMSIRPLPPDNDDPNEDAETRANRIRSFYKEYFDDSNPNKQLAGRVPQYPGATDYYEDYSQEYLGDGAIFDPETGNFVVANTPYAEPVTRRAMTPPPRAPPRFRGGPGGHSATSSIHSHGTFAPPPRGMSAMSGRMHNMQPRRKLPPPKDLKSLPTPAMLKDDNILVFDSIDFAPPTSFRDRQAGRRPDSPMGVSRPYSPSVRAFTPLQNSYDDLSVMPSPHLLRKSGTFTGLDFAPPTRLRDIDTGSDIASIRSGRSGLSQAQVYNMRAGAYRVSRIPRQLAGTKQEINNSLKPNWNLQY